MASSGNTNPSKPPRFDLGTLFRPPSGPYPPRASPLVTSQQLYAPAGIEDSTGVSAKLPESVSSSELHKLEESLMNMCKKVIPELSQLAHTLKETITSASSLTQALSRELAESRQRNCLALAAAE
ncbi:Uncharacterized protein Rs2_51298 [Raphanus sativus]|uniref:Varicose-related protein-like n=1 Tax=Raphanus sativus TaxID=3726 RepID=A0A9W3CZB5_RAPSA|nr:varicose-related protein-like [Raphanus sativus]KAJ4867165.1 Uncharacterized protein Rs2_51298 [Raphanus sativus]